MLDPTVYREAAADESDTTGAAIAIGVTVIAGTIGSIFSTLSFYGRSPLLFLVMTVIQIASFLLAVAAVARAAKSVAAVHLSFGQLFRPLAYAQAIGILGIIAPLAILAGLWRLVTSVAAIRGVAGCDTGKAIVLLLVGFVVTFVAGLMATPILMLLSRF